MGFAGNALTVNVNKVVDLATVLSQHTEGAGYHAAIVTVGTAEAVRCGLQLLQAKGRLVLFAPGTRQTPVDLLDVHVRELEIIGACNDDNRLDAALPYLEDTLLGLERLITHRFPISHYEEAFALAEHRHAQAMKVALTFDGAD